ncbi:hypothetical protein PG996_015969 [Apiospora saccharicola]|uniref:Uncharacterized protein n=1 Tax=Apiospora saccharicola TaxID=335842 RepID=A0ABR1TML5_9PEZI
MDKVVPYLNELRQQGLSDLEIGKGLLRHAKPDSLSQSLLTTLLTWSRSPELLALCLVSEEAAASRSMRKIAIKQLGFQLAEPTLWEAIWAALGGTVGLVDLFARSSVEDVKALANSIGWGSRKVDKPAQHAAAVADLLRALVPTHHKSNYPSPDKRPIQHIHARMVRACSYDFLSELLRSQDKTNPLYIGCHRKRIEGRLGAWMQTQVIDMLHGRIPADDNLRSFLTICVTKEPSKPTEGRHISASMAFSLRLLRGRIDGTFQDKWWQSELDELQILWSVYHRMEKKRTPKREMHELAVLAMDLADAKPKLRTSPKLRLIWNRLFGLWKRDPTPQHEKLVAQGLRWGLDSGSAMTLGRDCRNRMILLRDDLKWPLLRLYCLHVPDKGVDIDIAQDLSVFAKQKWPYELFEQLVPVVPQKVIGLLKRLLDANPDYSLLSPPDAGQSILSISDLLQQKNFNVELLLTMLQREDSELQGKTAIAVDNLRKKSATARDQHHRAQLAKGAAALAIATGDLGLYADTITWQQRFVRDPLTLKVVFDSGIVGTREGIELLSGIPKDLPAGCKMDGLVERMDIADGIFLTLQEGYKTAKTEPSFQESDWRHVRDLFFSAFQHRYSQLQNIPKQLGVSGADIFRVVWERTMKMVDSLGAGFLGHIIDAITKYTCRLPPTTLAIAAKALLEADSKRRARKDRKNEDRMLESISYAALLQLAGSDEPRLAHDLILQTILDRPDASSWHRQFLSAGYLTRLPAQDAQALLFGLARGIGEKLEEQSFVKVGEAEPAKHAPPRSLVKVTTVKHLAQLLDNADYISVEAAVEVLAELFQVATHRDIRIATLQSICNVLTKLGPGEDGRWESNPLAMKVLTAVETVIPVAASVNARLNIDWETALQNRELPEISEDNEALLQEILMRDGLGNLPTNSQSSSLISLYANRIVWPLWQASLAEHRRWVEVFLLKHDAPVSVRDLPEIPTLPESWKEPLYRYWRLMPFEALETFHKYTVWYFDRPAALRQFSAALRSNAELRKLPDVAHFLRVYDSDLFYGVCATMRFLSNAKTDDESNALPRLLDMLTEQCTALLGDYESHVDGWHEIATMYRPPTGRTALGPKGAHRAKVFSEWNSKGRVVLERMVALVTTKKETYRKEGRHSLLPPTTTLRLWLNPFTGAPSGQEMEEACREYATSLRGTMQTLLEGGNHHLQWHKIAEEAKNCDGFMVNEEEQLRVAVHLGQLVMNTATTTTTTTTTVTRNSNTMSALNLVQVSVAMHLIQAGKTFVTKIGDDKDDKDKPKPTVVEKRRLAGRLGEMVGTWLRCEDEMVREMALEWKRQQRDLFASLEKETAAEAKQS